MNQIDINRRLSVLSNFAKSKNKKEFVQICDEKALHTICELCYNIIYGKGEMTLNKRTIKKLLPIRSFLHTLANPRGSFKKKRLILSQISDHYPIFTKTIIPTLNRIYGDGVKKKR